MATSKNALTQFESGQEVNDFAIMTDSGDHKIHTISGGTVFSGKSGFTADVRPNGIVTGRNMVSPDSVNDSVAFAAFTAYSIGVLKSVSAATLAISRAATDVAKIVSVTMNSSGTVIEVEGEDSADTTLSTVRGAAGGPPSIPVDSVEIAQVRMTTNTAGLITTDEIFQTPGNEAERFDSPGWTVNTIGDGDDAETSAQKNAYVEFDSAFPLIHGAVATDPADAYKRVYVKYYAPILSDVQKSLDFTPAEETHSINSTAYYGGTSGATAVSLGQGGFTALMNDNITDSLIQEKNKVITIKHFPDRNKSPYTLTQGTLGVARTFPVEEQNQAECTITAENESANFAS